MAGVSLLMLDRIDAQVALAAYTPARLVRTLENYDFARHHQSCVETAIYDTPNLLVLPAFIMLGELELASKHFGQVSAVFANVLDDARKSGVGFGLTFTMAFTYTFRAVLMAGLQQELKQWMGGLGVTE